MGDLNEFSLKLRLFLRAYRWRRIDPVPWAPLQKPLSECRLALVSSAGFVLPGQEPFDGSIRGGDPSFREIPSDVEASTLIDTHRSESSNGPPLKQCGR
jgi:D-proline reductase (dithiol) PrdB